MLRSCLHRWIHLHVWTCCSPSASWWKSATTCHDLSNARHNEIPNAMKACLQVFTENLYYTSRCHLDCPCLFVTLQLFLFIIQYSFNVSILFRLELFQNYCLHLQFTILHIPVILLLFIYIRKLPISKHRPFYIFLRFGEGHADGVAPGHPGHRCAPGLGAWICLGCEAQELCIQHRKNAELSKSTGLFNLIKY